MGCEAEVLKSVFLLSYQKYSKYIDKMYLLYLLTGLASVKAQMHGNQAVPPQLQDELKCVSGFCLPRGYKKLETPKEG